MLSICLIFELSPLNCPNGMKTLYLTKEPDLAVRDDLSRISGEVVIVDCLNGYADWYRKKGYNCISLPEFFELFIESGNMKFDFILANPPFQSNDGNGELSGSGTGALWWKITQKSITLMKENGIMKFITPTNILNGGDAYTKLFLGGERKLDLKNVHTDVNQFFPKVGTKICRWTAQNSVTKGNTCIVNGDKSVNTEKTLKIYNDSQVQEIIQTLINYDGEKFDISVKNTADPRAVSRILQKDGYTKQDADEIARDFSKTQTDDYIYPINSNGKLKYGKVKWITNGTWKMMIPHLAKPMTYEIVVSDTIVCDQSCDVQYFENEQDAMSAKQVLDNPVYRWIIEQTKVGGRMSTAILSRFPNAPIEEVLTAEQLCYIQSQLS